MFFSIRGRVLIVLVWATLGSLAFSENCFLHINVPSAELRTAIQVPPSKGCSDIVLRFTDESTLGCFDTSGNQWYLSGSTQKYLRVTEKNDCNWSKVGLDLEPCFPDSDRTICSRSLPTLHPVVVATATPKIAEPPPIPSISEPLSSRATPTHISTQTPSASPRKVPTIVMCHILNGDSKESATIVVPVTEMEKHIEHGDSFGNCSGGGDSD